MDPVAPQTMEWIDRLLAAATALGALGTLLAIGALLWRAGHWRGRAEEKLDRLDRSVCRVEKATKSLDAENSLAHGWIYVRLDGIERSLEEQRRECANRPDPKTIPPGGEPEPSAS